MSTPHVYTVDDIKTFETRGPWRSKSGGELNVLFALSKDEVAAFLDMDNPEFDHVTEVSGHDIRGLRSYTVSGIQKDAVGGKEWHGVRTEYVRAVQGSVRWDCVDFAGNKREYVLDAGHAVMIPPHILHTYTGLESNTTLQVVCNTLFLPDEPTTHDTYDIASFLEASQQTKA